MAAVVQSDAVGELPPGVTARRRPVVAGARRALLGALPVGGGDVVHGLDVDLPAWSSGRTVSTVHDTAVFDTPWAFAGRRAQGERLLLRWNLRRADAVVADSAFTAERISALFGRDSVVVPLAPAPWLAPPSAAELDRVRRAHGLPDVFVLHVGTVEPRKDVPLLAAAARAVGVPLVLAGAVAAGQQVPPDARHLGYVDAADLPGLYALATVLAYPSQYEGFGLPPLEAMACGAAVLATTVGALPETLGDAAVLVPPRDSVALTNALRELVHEADRRAALRAAGLRRAATFTWERTADQTLEVYRGLGVSC